MRLFVSFIFQRVDAIAFGSCTIAARCLPVTFDDVQAIERALSKDNNAEGLRLMAFHLLPGEPDAKEKSGDWIVERSTMTEDKFTPDLGRSYINKTEPGSPLRLVVAWLLMQAQWHEDNCEGKCEHVLPLRVAAKHLSRGRHISDADELALHGYISEEEVPAETRG